MEWDQVIIAVITSLIVSLFVWMLTYIVPYIFPRRLSKTILFFTRIKYPIDPSEIRVYIDQYLKYADWKMLTAKGMLECIFEIKFNKFEKEEKKFWNELKDNVEVIPIQDAIKEVENALNDLEEPTESKSIKDFEVNNLSEHLKLYQDWYNENKTTKLWHFKELSREDLNKILNIDLTPNPEQGYPPATIMGKKMPYRGYTIEELANVLAMKNIKLIEVDGRWKEEVPEGNNIPTPESFLIGLGLEKPIDLTKSEKIKIFNKILLNLDLSQDDNIKGFSIALSDMEDFMSIFQVIIKEGSDITPLKIRFLNKVKNIERKVIKQ